MSHLESLYIEVIIVVSELNIDGFVTMVFIMKLFLKILVKLMRTLFTRAFVTDSSDSDL